MHSHVDHILSAACKKEKQKNLPRCKNSGSSQTLIMDEFKMLVLDQSKHMVHHEIFADANIM